MQRSYRMQHAVAPRAGPVVLLQGHAKAQLLLAGMLLKGLGTPRSPSEACYWLEQVPAAATEAVTAARAEVGASANAARYPVRVQMWQPGAQSRRRCGTGEPSPGADVAGGSPVPVQMCTGEPSPGADVAGVSPVPAQMWHGGSPVPALMWRG